jgi:thermostable 8-oxoguanine DNA glycosylase
MVQLKISNTQVRQFGHIVEKYKAKSRFPKPNYWKELDNTQLWLRMVGQVMVVGSSAGEERFMNRPDLKKMVSYNALGKMPDQKSGETLNYVMLEAGVRYASIDIEKCNKTCALIHNYKFVSGFKGGFKGLIQYLSEFNGDNAEMDRVNYLMRHLKYIKNKSSRDFLMGLGMNRNTLALDIRIQNIFNHFGIDFPSQGDLSRKSVYIPIERTIIQKVCEPLEIEPMKFDRILYQNYDEIVGKSRKRGKHCVEQ